MIFAQRIVDGFRKTYLSTDREKRNGLASLSRSGQRVDPAIGGVNIVSEQVKKMLQTSDQQLILMVRG